MVDLWTFDWTNPAKTANTNENNIEEEEEPINT